MSASPIETRGDGIVIHLRLTPGGGADRLEGAAVDSAGRVRLKARVRAAPEDGKANAALLVLLAKSLNLPRSALRLIAGQTARVKAVAAEGLTAEEALRRLGLADDSTDEQGR